MFAEFRCRILDTKGWEHLRRILMTLTKSGQHVAFISGPKLMVKSARFMGSLFMTFFVCEPLITPTLQSGDGPSETLQLSVNFETFQMLFTKRERKYDTSADEINSCLFCFQNLKLENMYFWYIHNSSTNL